MKKRKTSRSAADAIASRGGRKLHKKRKRIKLDIPPRIVYAFGITAALVVVVIMAFTLFFNVKQAEIQGCELYTYDQVLLMSGVNNNTNLLRMNTDVVEKRLVQGLPYIEEAKVTKRFPDSIDIELTPATQKANIDDDGRYMVISSQGVVLETDRKAPVAGLPTIKGFEPENGIKPGDEMKSKDNLKAKIVKTLLDTIDKLGFDKISDIDLTDRTNIVLRYDDRLDIYIGSSYDMEYKLEDMKLVIDKGLISSFRGMLRYTGEESGIMARSEDAIKSRDEARQKRKDTDKADDKKKQDETAQPEGEPQDGGEQGYEDGQDGGDPAQTEPPVTTAPPETTPPPPETTTWAGW
ncbi:MAG: FtsQ-type POTRA domain-containing protein [Ruminococcus sp.]|nr:FtsQ-type POTRA domain-containing protein [Ruminococcus sp.]